MDINNLQVIPDDLIDIMFYTDLKTKKLIESPHHEQDLLKYLLGYIDTQKILKHLLTMIIIQLLLKN